jgi:hypothetical protein
MVARLCGAVLTQSWVMVTGMHTHIHPGCLWYEYSVKGWFNVSVSIWWCGVGAACLPYERVSIMGVLLLTSLDRPKSDTCRQSHTQAHRVMQRHSKQAHTVQGWC